MDTRPRPVSILQARVILTVFKFSGQSAVLLSVTSSALAGAMLNFALFNKDARC